jgi:hypothetical protein
MSTPGIATTMHNWTTCFERWEGGDDELQYGLRWGGTFRVFSNWEVMRVIIPRALMKESRDSTWIDEVLAC